MAETMTVTVRLSPEAKETLDEIARSTGRAEAELIADAITEYIEVQRWQIEGIKEAIREADAGLVVPHEEVEAWARSLGTENELPRPEPRRMRRSG